MEPNFEQKAVATAASSVQVEDSVKSRILERIKAQMAQDSFDPGTGSPIPPIYLKAPDDWPWLPESVLPQKSVAESGPQKSTKSAKD